MPGEATLPGGRAFTKGGAECGTWRMRRPPPPVHRPQGCDVGPAAPGRRAASSCWGAAADAAVEGEPDIARAVEKWTAGARHFLADVFYNDNYNGEVVRCPEVACAPPGGGILPP